MTIAQITNYYGIDMPVKTSGVPQDPELLEFHNWCHDQWLVVKRNDKLIRELQTQNKFVNVDYLKRQHAKIRQALIERVEANVKRILEMNTAGAVPNISIQKRTFSGDLNIYVSDFEWSPK